MENKTVCVVEAADRTAISNPKIRIFLKDLIEVKFEGTALKNAVLKMEKIKNHNEISLKLRDSEMPRRACSKTGR